MGSSHSLHMKHMEVFLDGMMDWENRIKTNKNKITAIKRQLTVTTSDLFRQKLQRVMLIVTTSDLFKQKLQRVMLSYTKHPMTVNPCFQLLTVSSSDACAPFADLQETDF